MIIDFHAHAYYKTPGQRFTGDEFVAAMDQWGIDITVMLGTDQGDPGYCPPWSDDRFMIAHNNWSDEDVSAFCSSHPDRLVGLTSISALRYQPERKVERAIKEFGMKGVKIYPHSGFYPNDSRLFTTYSLCSQLGVPIVIHTGPKSARWQWLKYNNPINIDDIATNFPDLKIVMCHGGYPWVEEFIVVASSNPNIWVDLTFMDVIENHFRVPDLCVNTIRRLADLIGPKRLLWGTEGAYMRLPMFGNHEPEYYLKSQEYLVKRFDFFSDNDKADIIGNNAARLLGLNQN